MSNIDPFKSIVLALGCAAWAVSSIPAQANLPGWQGPEYLIKAHAGTTFTPLTPLEFDAAGNPTKFSHAVEGVVRVSSLGNCAVTFDVIAVPASPTSFNLTGTCRITSADGRATLDSEVTGSITIDPANPLFGNFRYDAKFTGGTGRMANARGQAVIDGMARFSADGGGKATWYMEGYVVTMPALSINSSGANAVLSWTGQGLALQSAEEATGPWKKLSTEITTDAARSEASVPATGPKKFFRLREEE